MQLAGFFSIIVGNSFFKHLDFMHIDERKLLCYTVFEDVIHPAGDIMLPMNDHKEESRMKKLVIYLLIFTMAFSLTACAAANKSITDLETFKEQILADWCKIRNYNADEESFIQFWYYGTDNGYHIVMFNLRGGGLCDMRIERIAGYTFDGMNSSCKLMAYKDGEFVDLLTAYEDGLISKEAIAKAAQLNAERKNATE